MAYAIDQEVKAIVDSCYAKAKAILLENQALLDKIAGILLERETLDGKEFEALMNGEELCDIPKEEQKTGGDADAFETEKERIDEKIDKLPKNEFLA